MRQKGLHRSSSVSQSTAAGANIDLRSITNSRVPNFELQLNFAVGKKERKKVE